MHHIDFTNRLTATLEGIPREQLVKFNNSWVLVNNEGNIWRYLVAYRALAHKVQNDAGAWVFPEPAPRFPGQVGTAWSASWNGPVGNAAEEGVVPAGRGRRYFDGIGIAHIAINVAEANINNAFVVHRDEIIANSDGYEDPRIFRIGDNYYVHSHRFQPFEAYAAPAPDHRVYRGYSPRRLPFNPGNGQALFVKVSRLNLGDGPITRGDEFFFGSNVSTQFEKNYGFFYDTDTLCAVYGVSPNDRPLTILRAVRGPGEVHPTPTIPGRFLVEEFQPNTDPATNNARDCFLHIQETYKTVIPGPEVVKFSSSGPLIWNGGLNRWQGVGHVITYYQRIFEYVNQITRAALAATPHLMLDEDAPEPETLQAAYSRLRANAGYSDAVANYLNANHNVALPFIAAYLTFATSQPVATDDVTRADFEKFLLAIRQQFVRSSMWNRVDEARALPQGTAMPWGDNTLANPRADDDHRAVLHINRFYYSFLYELEANTYRLHRFSNAFQVYDNNDPHFLQFAANLTPIGGGYLMGFGEDDNRAKVFHMTNAEYEAKVNTHAADGFDPVAYQFELTNIAQTILAAPG